MLRIFSIFLFFFFFNDTATTEIYTLSLHDALPISLDGAQRLEAAGRRGDLEAGVAQARREQLQDVGLVLDHQEPRLRLPLPVRRGRRTHRDLLASTLPGHGRTPSPSRWSRVPWHQLRSRSFEEP